MVYLLAFACTVGLVAMLIPVARVAGLVDHPGGRKLHGRPTPLVGGLAMGAICIGFLLRMRGGFGTELDAYLWASLILLAQGLLDDRHSLGPLIRVAGQVLAASVVAIGDGVRIESLGNLFGFGTVHLGFLAVPFTIFAIVGLINAFNMIDGLDGLAGSMILTASLLLLAASWWSGYTVLVPEIMTFMAVTLGFLAWNLRLPGREHAHVFLGDAGSTWAGFTVACLAILITQNTQGELAPMTAIWMLAVPVFDTIRLILRRRGQGRSIFDCGNEHLHHLLLACGYSVNATIVIMTAAGLGLGLFGLWLDRLHLPEVISTVCGAAAFVLFNMGARGLARHQPESAE
ncbi:MAG TPA: MraY family glycosyltransferase [Gammaproteobacteria bacterium]|nr:MraY family glycosyltransferase [Gammaproteobacteria bacterium]